MATLADRRRLQILALLDNQSNLNLRDLSEQIGLPETSIRKDLDFLEELNLIKRVQGGAAAMPHYQYEKIHRAKMDLNREKKERIGRAAADLIHSGDHIILDSGSTALQVASHICPSLRSAGSLTLYTTSLPVLKEIGACPGIRLILLAGIYLSQFEMLAGPQTVEHIRNIRADKVFFGTDGLTLSKGVTTANILEADLDQCIIQASKEMIVVADSSKIGVIGLYTMASLERVNKLVTDSDAPLDFLNSIRSLGVEVILA